MRLIVTAFALALAACGASQSGPRPAICSPVAAPAPVEASANESAYRFRAAQACVDHAAADVTPSHASRWSDEATNAVAACAAEVRASLLAMTEEERQRLSGSAVYALDIPISENDWTEYARERVETFSTSPCA